MGSLLKRVRGRLRLARQSSADQQLDALSRRLADIVSPKIRTVRGYAKTLREPVAQARAHAQNLVAALGDPVTISAQRWLPDPLVNALFVSVDQLRDVVFRNKEVVAVLGQGEARECFFLLTSSRVERRGFGSRLEGEIVRRDIPQTGVTFTDHRILAPSPDPDRTRELLVELALEFEAKRLAEHLLRKQARIRELGGMRDSLRVELKLLDLSAGGLHTAFSDQAAVQQKRDELKEVIQKIEQELRQANAGFQSLRDYLDYMRSALTASRDILAGNEIRLWLDEAGILANDQTRATAREIRFHELASGVNRRAAVLVRVGKSALKG